jgi:DNA-binding PadR family transcriptional regulator
MRRLKTPEELLPLTAPVFHILVTLCDGERHGYAIMRQVKEDTDGALELGPGTLYGCLQRMMTTGLVEESDLRPDPQLDDERRRYYRITSLGDRVVKAEAKRLAAAVAAARARRLLPRNSGE